MEVMRILPEDVARAAVHQRDEDDCLLPGNPNRRAATYRRQYTKEIGKASGCFSTIGARISNNRRKYQSVRVKIFCQFVAFGADRDTGANGAALAEGDAP